jgi:hypothetical protein
MVMMVIWSFGSFAFFMVPYYLTTIKNSDIYTLSIATEVAEFLASVLCVFITRIMTLDRAIRVFTVMVAISSIGMIYVTGNDEEKEVDDNIDQTKNLLNAGLILFTNLGVVCAFDIVYLICGELFPTILLATAYGCCNILGRLISISSPVVAKAPHPWPLIILACFGLFCTFLSMFLVKIK